MIARPQADILNMLPVTQVAPLGAKAVETGTSIRFDAALLQAAKAVRDGESGKPELVLVPKVRQALEDALGQLSQKPLDQLKTLAQQPQAARAEIAAIVSNVAQTFGLSGQEAGLLNDMLPVALPQVLAFKAQQPVPGTSVDSTRIDGAKPGPQGGTPVKAASPADQLTLDLESRPQPSAPALPDDAQDPRRGLQEALAQGLAVPVLVSTRTDDGSSSQGTVTLSRVNAPQNDGGAPAPLQPAAPGRVIQVLGQATEEQGAPSVAPAQPQPAPRAGSALPQPGPAPVEGGGPAPVRSQALPQASGAPGAPPQAPATGSTPVRGGRPLAGLPHAAELNVEFLPTDSAPPVQAQPGTEVTLKEDGTWVLPKADGQNAPPAPAPLGAPARPAPQPGSDAALLSAQPPSAPDGPASAPASAPQAPAIRTASAPPAPAFQALSLEPRGQAPQTPVAPQPPAAPANGPQAPAAQPQAGPAPAAPDAPQAPVAQGTPAPPAPVQAFVAAQVAPAPATPDGRPAPVQPDPAAPAAVFEPAPAPDAVQARRTAGEGAFGGLAPFGQDPVKTLAQQTARAYALRESVFRQVSEALREASPDQDGRLKIQLKPAELGEVNVELILKDGKLSARLVASQGEVRDAFVRDLPSFKAGLESQGVLVRDISVAVRAGVADQQQQPPRQPAPQPWRPEARGEAPAPVLSVPAPAGYAFTADATNQRFSALA